MPYGRKLLSKLNMHIGIRSTGLTCLLVLFSLMVLSSLALAATSVTLTVPDTAPAGSAVHISGSINDSGPLSGVALGITIKKPNDATYIVDQVTSDSAGLFAYDFTLPSDTMQGSWQVFVAGGGAAVNKAFIIAGASGVVTALPSTVTQGSQITFSGKLPQGNSAVGITVKDPNASVIFTNQTTAAADGSYSYTYTVPVAALIGNWTVYVAGAGTTGQAIFAVTALSSVGTGGGGGSTVTTVPVTSSNGSAAVNPSAGGTVSLGSNASVAIPANALNGSSTANITITQVTSPSSPPAGFSVLGTVYEFSVNGQNSYNFNLPVTLTFTFDPSSLQPGEIPSVHYYDAASSQWVNLGGTISGNTITITVNHFTKFAVMVNERTLPGLPIQVFSDVPSSYWAVDFINELHSLGCIGGYSDGSFKPDNSITRAEFATVLVKGFKLSPQTGKVFADTADNWAKEYISTALSNGIVSGYSDELFGPDDPITREQIALMIVKAAKITAKSSEITFADSADISAWARDAVNIAVQNHIMSGYPDNTLKPGGYATRAEAASIVIAALALK